MPSYARELEIATAAVRQAARVCRTVQANLVTAATAEKKDKSPVTVADYASQAVVCMALHEAFPLDPIVGEEAADELRGTSDAAKALLDKVTASVRAVSEREIAETQVLDAIDRGGFAPEPGKPGRYWALDPIDGTKGFLRGEQYAVALALVVDGQVVAGVLGCPNLPARDGGEPGLLMRAVRGRGTSVLGLDESDVAKVVQVDGVRETRGARFCESVESGHSDQDSSARIAAVLGITAEPHRIDSQCKYAAVARGDASIYLRLPTRKDYQEKIWDHAAGVIVVEEAGGRVTDVRGAALDFWQGRTLAKNAGVICTSGAIHDEVVSAVKKVLEG
jgi:3'(2'), 5'-bisphosphate nucleotidase